MRQQRTAHFLHKSSTSLRGVSQRARADSFRAYCSGGFRETGLPWLHSQFALFQPLDVMAQLQRGPQLQTHILHDHVTAQKHQSFSINLLWKQRTGLTILKKKKKNQACMSKPITDSGFLAQMNVRVS